MEQMETYRTLAVLSRNSVSTQTLFLKDAVQLLREEVYCIPDYQYKDSQADLDEAG